MVPEAVERLVEADPLAEELLAVELPETLEPDAEREVVWPCLLATLEADVLPVDATPLEREALAFEDDLVAVVLDATPSLVRTVEALLVPAERETAPTPPLRTEPVVVFRATWTRFPPNPKGSCPKW